MSLLAYKMIAPTLLVTGLMLPAIALWTTGQQSDDIYEKAEHPYTKYLHPAPIMVPDKNGSYRSLIIKMKVRNFKSANTICRYFPRIRDTLYFQLQDYPDLLDQKIGLLNHHDINLNSTIEGIIGKGRIKEIMLLDKEVIGSKKTLLGHYKCYRQHAEVITK